MRANVTSHSVHCCEHCRATIDYCDNEGAKGGKYGRFHKSFGDGDVVYCENGKHYCAECKKAMRKAMN